MTKKHQWDCSASTWCVSHSHTCRICGTVAPEGTNHHEISSPCVDKDKDEKHYK